MTSIAAKVREWLGEEGITFFNECLRDHGTVSPVLSMETAMGTLPHPVHFREGMQVRNFLRTLPECEGWDSHDYDNRWAGIVEEALRP